MEATGTQHQFGYEWERFPHIVPIHEEHFKNWIAPFETSGFEGKSFLDAGCGIGRNSYWPLKAGAAKCVAFDFDERTVNVARHNLRAFPQAEVRLKSIYDLTFENEFDIVFCVGVMHHLAHPEKAMANLVKALKPGGTLILWVYGKEGNETYLKVIDPLRKYVTSKLPPRLVLGFSKLLNLALRTVIQFPTKNNYFKLLRKMEWEQTEAIIFDQLIPTIANYWTKEEVRQLGERENLEEMTVTPTLGHSWTLIARKHGE